MLSDLPLILVADDSEDDAWLLRMAFEKIGAANPIQVLTDGDQVASYLAGTGVYADREMYPLPGLVLLDVRMPVRDGFEVLRWIRGRRELSGVAVVVLAGADRPADVSRAYSLGANGFLVKPGNFDGLMALLHTIKDFWEVWLRLRRQGIATA